jgi:hypothetical protein
MNVVRTEICFYCKLFDVPLSLLSNGLYNHRTYYLLLTPLWADDILVGLPESLTSADHKFIFNFSSRFYGVLSLSSNIPTHPP